MVVVEAASFPHGITRIFVYRTYFWLVECYRFHANNYSVYSIQVAEFAPFTQREKMQDGLKRFLKNVCRTTLCGLDNGTLTIHSNYMYKRMYAAIYLMRLR